MKIEIEIVHLGRYKVSFVEQSTYQSYDGGSAMIMLMLSKLIFEPEHRQYQEDQRASSDQLGNEVLTRIMQDIRKPIK